jgi:hypothetical protein
MENIQRTTNVAMIALALAAVIAMGLLMTPAYAGQIPECCEEECTSSCCWGESSGGYCVRCGEGGCCGYDGNLCEGGQIIECEFCDP